LLKNNIIRPGFHFKTFYYYNDWKIDNIFTWEGDRKSFKFMYSYHVVKGFLKFVHGVKLQNAGVNSIRQKRLFVKSGMHHLVDLRTVARRMGAFHDEILLEFTAGGQG
jgi:hypothetical protein